ncbi:flagellar filament capping protein FliD [Helicobacter sp. MIT 14-3879]|uniref:flagellar filament capping protein FliD n=1 Tax=Helicobacter sp. MIT 14-3879 TaxID=2040649 RepID=UPI000E1F737D|nr:flagellar filament capping protein FliD [Helicobacter sp. MIT 14-3879]RDU64731.1 flagellar filament capping protein FliD [Helicobacter sp. MIT 14-3879]
MNPLSSLGIGSSVLNYDVIDKLRKADENAQIAPIDKKIQDNMEKQTELVGLKTMLSSLNANAKKIADYSSYLQRNANSSDESKLKVSVEAGVPVQDINIKINEIAKNSVNEIGAKFASRDAIFSKYNTTLQLFINNKEFSINISSNDTLNDVAQKIIDNTDGLVNASIMKTGTGQNAYSLMINSKETGEANNIYFGNILESQDIPSGELILNENDFNLSLIDSNGIKRRINIPLQQNAKDSTSNANFLKDTIIETLSKDLDFANLVKEGKINISLSGDGKRLIINDKRGFEISIDGEKSSSLFNKSFSGEKDTLTGFGNVSAGLISGNISIGHQDVNLGEITSPNNSREMNEKAIIEAISKIDGYSARINDNGFLVINSNKGEVSIKASEENKEALSKLGIEAGDYKDWGILESQIDIKNIQQASNASLYYNGINISRPSNVIDDIVTGVTIELLGESKDDINVNIGRNNTAIIDEIKSFVENYNTLIQKLNELTRYDEDTKIAGIFNGNSDIRTIKSSLHRALAISRFENGVNESIANYGLSFNDNGILMLDESKLQSEISANPDKVMDFFRTSKTTINGKEMQRDGIFTLVEKELDKLIGNGDSRLKLFEDNLNNDDKRLKEDKKRNLELLNSRYEIMANRFAAYDSQIAKVNNSFNSLNMMIEQSIADKKK